MVGVPHSSMPMAVFRHHVASIDPNSNIDDIGFIGVPYGWIVVTVILKLFYVKST